MSLRCAFCVLLAAGLLGACRAVEPAPTTTPTPQPQPTGSASPTHTASPTLTFTPSPSPTFTPTPTSTPTTGPSATPTPSPTASPTPVCECGSNVYDCANFSTQAGAQACFAYCWEVAGYDVHHLDRDEDNRACEALP